MFSVLVAGYSPTGVDPAEHAGNTVDKDEKQRLHSLNPALGPPVPIPPTPLKEGLIVRRHVVRDSRHQRVRQECGLQRILQVTKSCSDLDSLDTGSNSWQLTAATFVGLMSVPGLAVLYGGLVPKKWVVNTMFMAFSGFSTVLVVWVLWAYKMGFGVADRRWLGEHVQLHVRQQLLQELLLQLRRPSGDIAARRVPDHQASLPIGRRRPAARADDGAVLLPVRVRRHHAAAVPG